MSEENCKNDCTTPLRFPRRPGTEPALAHRQDCPCCSLTGRVSQDNRPSLAHFNYRIGTYGTMREFLFHQVNRTPELLNWTHRAPDDPAAALLEGAAILGDILAFYQDTYANEAFLRTARWRESVSDLVRLLGYRLSPAVGGKATFAFEIKKDEPVIVPAGFPVKATLEEIVKPAEFETTKEIIAYPWLSRFSLFAPLAATQFSNDEFEIELPGANDQVEIKAGDRLLMGKSDAGFPAQPSKIQDADIVIVDSIRERHGVKIYKVKGGLIPRTDITNIIAYRIGRSFHHFGYNSPAQVVNPANPVETVIDTTTVTGHTITTSTINYLPAVPFIRPISLLTGPFSAPSVSPPVERDDYPLEIAVQDIPNNAPIVIQARFNSAPANFLTIVRTIARIDPVTMTWGAISGAVSRIRVSSPLSTSVPAGGVSPASLSMYTVDALFHEVTSPPLKIKPAGVEITGSGNTLNFFGTAPQARTLEGRGIMMVKKGAAPELRDVRAVLVSPGDETSPRLHQITLSRSVVYAEFPQQDPVYTIYGNLADADEGKTVPETAIGDGDETQIFQNFKLPKTPLTYHIVPANTPLETPEAEIYVDGRLWKKVDSFFDHLPDEHIYIIREDTDGNSWVQFGDGKTGARLNSGTKNVTARYRIGDGAYGPLKADTKVQASAKLKNLDKIQMPAEATGGAQPEDTENARSTAPGKVQSLGRIVSLKDFEFEAMAIQGVAAASAAWQLDDNVPRVVITVLMETGRDGERAAVQDALNSYNSQRGAGRNAVSVNKGERVYTAVSVEYALEPTYRADLVEPAIRLALGVNHGKATRDEDQTGLFSLRRRRFGAAEYASSIEGSVQNVEGVLWAKTVGFSSLGISDDPSTIPPPPPVFNPVITCDTCGADFVLSLYDSHLSLTEVAEGGS